jgi:hypothetical protein
MHLPREEATMSKSWAAPCEQVRMLKNCHNVLKESAGNDYVISECKIECTILKFCSINAFLFMTHSQAPKQDV